MGKKGKRNKKKDKKSFTQPGTAPGRQGMGLEGMGLALSAQSEIDNEWVEYVKRLRESRSHVSQNFIMATDLALQAFITRDKGDQQTAASLLMNAFLSDERATGKVIRHITFTACNGDRKQYAETMFMPMVNSSGETTLVHNVLLYFFAKPVTAPSELLVLLNKCTEYINRKDYQGSQNLDHATVLIWKAIEFTALGRSRKSLRLLEKAAKIGDDGLTKNLALWCKVEMLQVGIALSNMDPVRIAQDVVDLEYIEQMTLKEDRVRPSVLVRLSNIHVVCGNIKTANMYREKYKESIVCVNLLHPPSARLSIDVKFFNELWEKIDQGQAPEISGDLLYALQLGVVENKEDDEDHDDDGKKTETSSTGSNSLSLDVCIVCGSLGKKKCGGCKCVQYCGTVCATKHWKSGHKKECKKMKKMNKEACNGVKLKSIGKMQRQEQNVSQQRQLKFSQSHGAKATESTVKSRAVQRRWIRECMKEPAFVKWWLDASPKTQAERLRSRIPDMPIQEQGPGSSMTPFLTINFLCSKCNCDTETPDVVHKGASWFLHLLSELGSEKMTGENFSMMDLCWHRYISHSKYVFISGSGKIPSDFSAIYAKRSCGLDVVTGFNGSMVRDEDVGIGDWAKSGRPNAQHVAALTKSTSTIGSSLMNPTSSRMCWQHI